MALVVFPRQVLLDAAGVPRNAAKAYFYQAGTSTPIITYKTAAYDIPHENPVEALTGGVFPAIFINPAVNPTYKIAFTDENGVALPGDDNIPALGFSASDIGTTLYPRTAAEVSAAVIPVNYAYPGNGYAGGYNTIRVDMRPSSSSATNTSALQGAIDVMAAAGGGIVWIPEGADSYDFNGNIQLKDKVSILAAGPFATVLACTQAGVPGIYSSGSALSGITLAGFQLVGTDVANASENGIQIVGHATGGFPKLVLRNLLARSWGNVGIDVENGFDAAIENCNASSNKSHGLHLISCFSMSGGKNVAWQNEGHGFLIQSAAGSLFSGTAQENSLNGWRIESAQGCTFATYVEQNGHAGSASTTAQVLVTQRSGGYAVSSGNKINTFALGGKGSTSPTYESGYGVYCDFAEDNEINGSLGGHLTNDIFFSSNSARNDTRTVKYLTGLAGGDTTTPVADNGTSNNVPVKIKRTIADSGTGNVGSGEDDLKTYSLAANSLYMNGQTLEVDVAGTTAANANNKTLKLYLGSTVLYTSGAVAANAQDWRVVARITRLSATSQQVTVTGIFNGAAIVADPFLVASENLATALTIKCTGEATADNDIVQRGLIVRGL